MCTDLGCALKWWFMLHCVLNASLAAAMYAMPCRAWLLAGCVCADLVPLQPEPVLRRNVPVEDLTFDIDDVVGSDDLETGQPAAGGAAPGGGDADEGRVALKFKTQGNEDVTVRVRACEPLAKAMASFREYVVQQGWGAVDKFLSPDGEKLSGEETAQELELEDGDIIEVYLQH